MPQVHPRFQFILICGDTCVFLMGFFLSPISFQQIYPVLVVSLGPRLHDVKPSESASSLFSILCKEISRSSLAWRRDATERTFILCQRNKSLTMKNHFEEMGRNFCSLRFINGDIRMDNRSDKSVNFRYRYRELRVNARIQCHFSSH